MKHIRFTVVVFNANDSRVAQKLHLNHAKCKIALWEETMIRFRLPELLADKAFREKRRIEWKEVAEATGIHRTTLSRMLNTQGYNATTSNLDLLCRYFNCQVGDIATYIPDLE